MNDKAIRILLGALLVLSVVAFYLGHFTGRGSARDRVMELETTTNKLNATVDRLEQTIRKTGQSYNELRRIHDADTDTIAKLTDTSRQLEELITAQRSILDAASAASETIGSASDELTDGLIYAVKTVEGIIENVQTREN